MLSFCFDLVIESGEEVYLFIHFHSPPCVPLSLTLSYLDLAVLVGTGVFVFEQRGNC